MLTAATQIDDLPTRFKYIQVPKATYGLSPVEILLADDAALNQVVGIKQMQPYRRGNKRPADLGRKLHEFRRQLGAKETKAAHKEAKGKGKASAQDAGGPAPADATAPQDPELKAAWSVSAAVDGAGKKKKRTGKKERERAKREAAEAAGATNAAGAPAAADGDERPAKRSKVKAEHRP